MNEWNACAFCGEQVGRARLEGYTAWSRELDGEEEITGRETVCVVHTECYMRATPEERWQVLERAAEAG